MLVLLRAMAATPGQEITYDGVHAGLGLAYRVQPCFAQQGRGSPITSTDPPQVWIP